MMKIRPLLKATSLVASRRMASSKFKLADRFLGTEENMWVRYTGLAAKMNACNLGQGFPDFDAPDNVRKALANATLSDDYTLNQYTRGYGKVNLVNSLAKLYGKELKREINPMSEIVVTAGAYEALFCAFQSLLNPGDEVVIIEPFYDCYKPMSMNAGAKPVFVPLRPPDLTHDDSLHSSADWKLDEKELEAAFSPKTKFLVLNNPNNPLGKTYTQDELEMIARLCVKYDTLCVSDEVYEWMAIKPNEHLRIANMPGMWDRTVTIGSAGKTFSVTGWKLGWAIGPENLIKCLQIAHQNCLYTCSTPGQEACASGFEEEIARLGKPDCFLNSLAEELKDKRDMMVDVLKSTGFKPIVPEGGYFMVADFSKYKHVLPEPTTEGEKKDATDVRFVIWLTEHLKLATIPVTCFYSEQHRHVGENYIRFCYIKKDETLVKAKSILEEVNKLASREQ